MTLTEAIENVRNDNLSGARSITHRVASIVETHIQSISLTSVDLKQELLDLGRAMIDAQPAMAPLFNLFNSLLRKLDASLDRREIPAILTDHVQDLARAMNDHGRLIAEHLIRTIPQRDKVFTHSDSSTLRAAIQHDYREGKQCTVYCTESRPACEGSKLAQALVADGISVCLFTDSLIFSLLQESPHRSVILVGADSITTEGVINKAGTLGLGLAAKHWNVPLYVLAGSEKFLPAGLFPKVDQDKPSREILSRPPARLRIINRYFDVTPLEFVTAVICEEGLVSAADLPSKLEQLPVHSDLVAILARDTRP